jgi:hypothetical protein
MYNNSDDRSVLHFLTSTSKLLTVPIPNLLPSFHERPSGRHSHLQTNILLICTVSSSFYLVHSAIFNMLFNTLTLLGFATLVVAGKYAFPSSPSYI